MDSLEDEFRELELDKDPMTLQKETKLSWKSATEPKWEDITELVKNATEEMELGQLLHKENFTLNEAMSAVEVRLVNSYYFARKRKKKHSTFQYLCLVSLM